MAPNTIGMDQEEGELFPERGSGVGGNAPVLSDDELRATPERPERNLTAEQEEKDAADWVLLVEAQQRIERMKHDLEVCWAERDRLRDALKEAIAEANNQAEARTRNRHMYEDTMRKHDKAMGGLLSNISELTAERDGIQHKLSDTVIREARRLSEVAKLKALLTEAYPELVIEDTAEGTIAAAIKMVRVNHSSVQQMARLAEYLRDNYPNAQDGTPVVKTIAILEGYRQVVEVSVPMLWNDVVQPAIQKLMAAHALPKVLGPFHGLEHNPPSE
jgi:hypothetical protein